MLDRFPLFDSHLHIINKQFPLVDNQGYTPDEFTCDDYLRRTAAYKLYGGAIVSGSFQAFDQEYLLNALAILGDTFVGVTQLPASVSDDEIIYLNKMGVRALRFNLHRGGSEQIDQLVPMANRVFEIAGWHVELYLGSVELTYLQNIVIDLPSVSIDHLGLEQDNLALLTKLLEQDIRIKASGFGRVDFDVSKTLQKLYSINPQALMFGTDLPSTRARRPYLDDDYLLVIETFSEAAAKDIFYNNAVNFYRPGNTRY